MTSPSRDRESLESVRRLLLSSRLTKARALIRALGRAPRKLLRADRLQLAYLASQADLPEITVQVLRSIVRPREGRKTAATAEEKAEYAHALGKLGAYREAGRILSEIDPRLCPRAALFLAVNRFRAWDWLTPLPGLEALARRSDLPPHDRLRGMLYLGAALIHGKGDFARAQAVLESVVAQTRAGHYPRSHVDALQLLAQQHIFRKDWALAHECLEKAERTGRSGADSFFQLLVRQWKAILTLHTSRRPGISLLKLQEIERCFRELGLAESARSCAYYSAICRKDETLMTRLYFGTPHPGFRKKLLDAFGRREDELPDSYELSLGSVHRKPRFLSLLDGENGFSPARLKAGQAPQRLLAALAADAYERPNLTGLHDEIYPGDAYNPVTSPVRVRQVMKRLRRWLAHNHVPLEIIEHKGRYHLASKHGLLLRIPRAVALKEDARMQAFLARLRRHFGANPFQSQEVERLFEVSDRTAQNRLKLAVSRGLLKKSGRTSAIRYRF